jgi:hypothetical protein
LILIYFDGNDDSIFSFFYLVVHQVIVTLSSLSFPSGCFFLLCISVILMPESSLLSENHVSTDNQQGSSQGSQQQQQVHVGDNTINEMTAVHHGVSDDVPHDDSGQPSTLRVASAAAPAVSSSRQQSNDVVDTDGNRNDMIHSQQQLPVPTIISTTSRITKVASLKTVRDETTSAATTTTNTTTGNSGGGSTNSNNGSSSSSRHTRPLHIVSEHDDNGGSISHDNDVQQYHQAEEEEEEGKDVLPGSLDIHPTISELSDGPFSPEGTGGALLSGSPINKKAIHNFFFPPRLQQQQLAINHQQPHSVFVDDTFEDEPAADVEATTATAAAAAANVNSKDRQQQCLQEENSSRRTRETLRRQNQEQRQRQPIITSLDRPSGDENRQGGTEAFHETRRSSEEPSSSYPSPQRSQSLETTSTNNGGRGTAAPGGTGGGGEAAFRLQEKQDNEFVERFWTIYDELLILSLFTQIGIICRLAAASFFRAFDGVFQSDSALFTNLPLNCLSCFVMGLLCSGESLMEIISTRFTPPRLQQDLHREAQMDLQEQQQRLLQNGLNRNSGSWSLGGDDILSDDDDLEEMETAVGTETTTRRRRRPLRLSRRRKRQRWKRSSSLFRRQQANDVLTELREVQLLAWERRIRASICLLLFPVQQEDVDVVENYFSDGYRRRGQPAEHDSQSSEPHLHQNSCDDSNWRDYSIEEDGQTGEVSLNDVEEEGGFDDLILQEEDGHDDNDIPPSVRHSASADSVSTATSTIDDQLTMEGAASNSNNNNSPPMPLRPTPSSSQCPPVSPVLANTSSTAGRQRVRSPGIRTSTSSDGTPILGHQLAHGVPHVRFRQFQQVDGGQVIDYGTQNNPDLDQVIEQVAVGVQQNISRFQRVNLANGWDVGTSPVEKSEDLMLGLRDGLCGALSSFSSWISSMVNLFRAGQIGQGFVGLILGIQLPLVAYRFGQYVSVYIFVWRCRREKRQSEKRGYGLQLHADDESNSMDDFANRSHQSGDSGDDMSASQWTGERTKGRRTVHDEESEVPSVRAIVTALFIMALVAQLSALHFFYEPQHRLLALSLLFSPLGVLARW